MERKAFSPSSSTTSTLSRSVNFDPKVVARKEDGWMEMLEGVIGKWMGEVEKELREEGGDD